MLTCAYVVAGCDFTAGTFGVTHEHYRKAAIRHQHILGSINRNVLPEVFEVIPLLAYLAKNGLRRLVTPTQKKSGPFRWNENQVEA